MRLSTVAVSGIVLVAFLALAAIALRFTATPVFMVGGSVVPHRVADVGLTSDTGGIVHLDNAPRGAFVVVGYTRCTDACPLAIAKVVAAARPLRRDARPSLFFVTVDPAYDTAPTLHRYLAAWHNDVTGLTGHASAVRRVISSLGAGSVSRAPADHDTRLFLIDRSGEVVSDIPPDIAIDDLRGLLATVTPPTPAPRSLK